jgi:uncharacterized protein (TIGR02466 family)
MIMNKVKSGVSNKDQLPYDVMALFPLPIYKTNIGREFTKQEQDELDIIINEQLRAFEAERHLGVGLERYKAISIDKYLLKRKSFLSIQSFIEHHLKEFATTVLGIDLDKTSWSPHITNSWLNVYTSKKFESFHNHDNCIISGVFYINCLKGVEVSDKVYGYEQDGLWFAPSAHNMLELINLPMGETQDTMFCDKPCRISAVEGDLILFPSTAKHGVSPNETTDQTRISLAFNCI